MWLLGDNTVQLEARSINFTGTFIDEGLYNKLWDSLNNTVEKIKNHDIESPEDLISLIYGWEDTEPELDLDEGSIVYTIYVEEIDDLPSIDKFNEFFKFIYEKAGIKEYVDKEIMLWRIVNALTKYIRFLRRKKPEEYEPLFEKIFELNSEYDIAVKNCYEKDPSTISVIETNYLVNPTPYNRLLNCVKETLNV